jgi:ribose-phosphate pyrophosphokinase
MNKINFITGEGFKVITFPDGEKHLKVNELNPKEAVDIICRITNSDDLFLLMQLSDIIQRQELVVRRLYITYLMGMRCDRVFSMNEAFTLKIITNVINSFNAVEVWIEEPHSLRTEMMTKGYGHNITLEFVRKRLGAYTVCLPDEGAYMRYGKYGAGSYVLCKKKRDVETGELSGFAICNTYRYRNHNGIVVIDDLCDGGGTFVGIAELLRKELAPKELVLVVTHAVQEAGLKKVASVYDKVYITDSYKDWSNVENLPSNISVIKLEY